MLRKFAFAALVGLTTGAAGMMTSQAFPIAFPPSQVGNTADVLQLAKCSGKHCKKHGSNHHNGHNKGHGHGHNSHVSVHVGVGHVGHGRWHGHRYHNRHGAYIYYYGGWWYPTPWWTLGYTGYY